MEPYKMETPLGNLYLSFTDNNHVHVTSGRDEALTVRKVQYHVGIHVYRYADGQWYIGEEGQDDYQKRRSLYTTRVDNWSESVSEPARKTIAEEVTQAVRNFVVNNSGILLYAEREYRRLEYDKAIQAVTEKKAELTELVKVSRAASKAYRQAADALY